MSKVYRKVLDKWVDRRVSRWKNESHVSLLHAFVEAFGNKIVHLYYSESK